MSTNENKKPAGTQYSNFYKIAFSVVTAFVATAFFTLPNWAEDENAFLAAFLGGNFERTSGDFFTPILLILLGFVLMFFLAKSSKDKLLPLTSLQVLFVIAGCLFAIAPVLETLRTYVSVVLAAFSFLFLFRSFGKMGGFALGMIFRIVGLIVVGVSFNASMLIFSQTSGVVSFAGVFILAVALVCWVRAEMVGEV